VTAEGAWDACDLRFDADIEQAVPLHPLPDLLVGQAIVTGDSDTGARALDSHPCTYTIARHRDSSNLHVESRVP
jgi:hypothetical protein